MPPKSAVIGSSPGPGAQQRDSPACPQLLERTVEHDRALHRPRQRQRLGQPRLDPGEGEGSGLHIQVLESNELAVQHDRPLEAEVAVERAHLKSVEARAELLAPHLYTHSAHNTSLTQARIQPVQVGQLKPGRAQVEAEVRRPVVLGDLYKCCALNLRAREREPIKIQVQPSVHETQLALRPANPHRTRGQVPKERELSYHHPLPDRVARLEHGEGEVRVDLDKGVAAEQ